MRLIEHEVETVDTVPVVHGRWFKKGGMINCSVCKRCRWPESFEYTVIRFNYCPNCGAEMDEGDGDQDEAD